MLKKFISGLLLGAILSACSVVYASESIQATLWPVKIDINGKTPNMDSEYSVLNYNGHAYVPIRYIAENLGLGIRYTSTDNLISIMNEPKNLDEVAKKVWEIQYLFRIGTGQHYVKDIIGDPSVITADEKTVWRYDIAAVHDYKYMGSNIDNSGLEKGSIGAQLFITWSADGSIEKIYLGYTQRLGNEKKLYVYYVFPDGSTSGGLSE